MSVSIQRSTERDKQTRQFILDAESKRTQFGLTFLDDSLYGMLPNDLVLIGAKTGRGKTALAVNIAKHNAMLGKRVVFIALEAEENEIEMRLRYQIEASLLFQDETRDRSIVINYRNWRFGKLERALARHQDAATLEFNKRYATLLTIYRRQGFGVKDLNDVLEKVKGKAELVILDHLHYLDMESGQSENESLSALMKKMRELNLFYNIPFVVAAHLRKSIESLIPGDEDFRGSGDIGKIATTCIMLTPQPDKFNATQQTSSTIISIAKSRTGGLGNLCGIMDFSIRHQAYLPFYRLAYVFNNGGIKELEEAEYPDWASKLWFKKSPPTVFDQKGHTNS
jgi:replicative DNA helicase